jgi:CheY-like chemotaxis protein
LKGLRVFVVEDEYTILVGIEDMLGQLGCELFGSASRLKEALGMIDQGTPDLAILDINLNGEMVYPLAEALAARGVPIVFATGYLDGDVSEPWRTRPIVTKPYRLEQIAAAFRLATAGRAASAA